jgi:hypothetical protein
MRNTIAAITALATMLGASAPAFAGSRIHAEGEFIANVDFTTLTLTPVGANCLLVVDGVLEFSGTLEGSAPGTTRALVLADCGDVGANPPGSFKDLFRSKLEFFGTVDGGPAIGEVTYQGITQVGGAIKAHLRLSDGLKGLLKVDAVVAVGGTYSGWVRVD